MTVPSITYRIALLVKNGYLPAWQYLMLEKLIHQQVLQSTQSLTLASEPSKIQIVGLFTLTQPDILTKKARLAKTARQLLLTADSHLFKARPQAQQPKAIHSLLGDLPQYALESLQHKNDKKQTANDLNVSMGTIDLVIDLIGLDASVLQQQLGEYWPVLGVWQYFYGKNKMLNDQYIALAEYLQGELELVAGLQQVCLDHNDATLFQGNVQSPMQTSCLFYATTSTHPVSLMRSIEAHLWKMADFVPERLKALQQVGEAVFEQRAQERYGLAYQALGQDEKIKDMPSTRLLYGNYTQNLLKKINEKLTGKEQWILLADHVSNPLELNLKQIPYQLIPPADRLWADPFVVNHEDKHYIFFEELVYDRGLGHLSCLQLYADGSYSTPVRILERPYHLSFPFIFEYKNQYYMIPETAENHCIELYRCTQFPDQWVFEKNLMEAVQAYDSTVFFHEGTWWLLASIRPNQYCLPNEALYLFYADSPLSQNWQAHPENPVVSSASSARPAGALFEWEGCLYRPSQNCAGSYGKSLNINQVTQLNKQYYQEKQVHAIEPVATKNLNGVHTLNFNEQLVVMDAIYIAK